MFKISEINGKCNENNENSKGNQNISQNPSNITNNSNNIDNNQSSNLNVNRDAIDYIQTEIGLIKFLDTIAEDPFELIFQDKLISLYSKRLFEKLLGVSIVLKSNENNISEKSYKSENFEKISKNNQNLRNEFERLNITTSIFEIIKKSEEVAKSEGINTSYSKKSKNVNLYTMIGFIVALILVNIIPGLTDFYFIVFLILMPLICFLPQYMAQRIQKNWLLFKEKNNSSIKNELGSHIQKIRTFNQLIIDDCRNICIDNRIPLQVIQFDLYYGGYDGINITREMRSLQGNKFICLFEYPEGVKPLEIPETMSLSKDIKDRKKDEVSIATGSDVEVSEDHENDLFILAKAVYEPSSSEPTFETINNADEILTRKIESLLENSEFYKVKNPANIFNAINKNNNIRCKCGSELDLAELDLVKSKEYPNFEFLFVINKKCKKCNANPFILLKKKNIEIPNEFNDIF